MADAAATYDASYANTGDRGPQPTDNAPAGGGPAPNLAPAQQPQVEQSQPAARSNFGASPLTIHPTGAPAFFGAPDNAVGEPTELPSDQEAKAPAFFGRRDGEAAPPPPPPAPEAPKKKGIIERAKEYVAEIEEKVAEQRKAGGGVPSAPSLDDLAPIAERVRQQRAAGVNVPSDPDYLRRLDEADAAERAKIAETGATVPPAPLTSVAARTGLQRARQNIAALTAPLHSKEETASTIADAQNAMPPQPEFMKAADEQYAQTKGFFGALDFYLTNPRWAYASMLQGMVQSGVTMAGGAVGGAATGGPVGAAVGAGIGGYADTYGETVMKTIADSGVNLGDKDAVLKALNDQNLMATANAAARKAGVPAAVINAMSFGVMGRLGGPIARKLGGGIGARAAGVGAEAGAQGVIGAGGEAGQQAYEEGGITDPGAIVRAGASQVATTLPFVAHGFFGHPDPNAPVANARPPGDSLDTVNTQEGGLPPRGGPPGGGPGGPPVQPRGPAREADPVLAMEHAQNLARRLSAELGGDNLDQQVAAIHANAVVAGHFDAAAVHAARQQAAEAAARNASPDIGQDLIQDRIAGGAGEPLPGPLAPEPTAQQAQEFQTLEQRRAAARAAKQAGTEVERRQAEDHFEPLPEAPKPTLGESLPPEQAAALAALRDRFAVNSAEPTTPAREIPESKRAMPTGDPAEKLYEEQVKRDADAAHAAQAAAEARGETGIKGRGGALEARRALARGELGDNKPGELTMNKEVIERLAKEDPGKLRGWVDAGKVARIRVGDMEGAPLNEIADRLNQERKVVEDAFAANKARAAPAEGALAEKREAAGAPAATDEATARRQKTAEALGDLLGRAGKRMAMEAHGQGILDDLQEKGTKVNDVAKKFWSDTYYKLPAEAQGRFRRMLEDHSGLNRGAMTDIAETVRERMDLPDNPEHLEGTDRGFVALMDEANRRVGAQGEKGKKPAGALAAKRAAAVETPEAKLLKLTTQPKETQAEHTARVMANEEAEENTLAAREARDAGTAGPRSVKTERDEAFHALADAQRGEPEKAMLRAQHTGNEAKPYHESTNAWTYAMEHVGDLTHRMSEPYATSPGAKFGLEYVEKKIRDGLRVAENAVDSKNIGNIPADHPVVKAGEAYAAEHAKLPVYNEAQRAARDAAVALGKRDMYGVLKNLHKLQDMIEKGTYETEAGKYDPNFEKKPAGALANKRAQAQRDLPEAAQSLIDELRAGRAKKDEPRFADSTARVRPEDVEYNGYGRGVGSKHEAVSENGHTLAAIRGDGNMHVLETETEPGNRSRGEATARMERLAQEAHGENRRLVSGDRVSAPAQRIYDRLRALGYDVKENPNTVDPSTGEKKSASELKGVYEVGPKKGESRFSDTRGDARKEQMDRFLKDFNEAHPPNPLNDRERVVHYDADKQHVAMMTVRPSVTRPGYVHLEWMATHPQRAGVGSAALKKLQEYVKEYGLKGIELHAWGRGKVPQRDLIRFYKQNGFAPSGKNSPNMHWDAEPKSAAATKAAGPLAAKRQANLKRWFGKSVVKNEDGSPRVVYHGTDADVGSPSGVMWLTPDRRAAAGFADRQAFGNAERGEEDYRSADEYSPKYDKAEPAGQNVMPLYARIEKPLDLTDLGQTASLRDVAEHLEKQGVLEHIDDETLHDIAAELGNEDHSYDADSSVPVYRALEALGAYDDIKKAGYDGVHITDNDVRGAPIDAYAAFDPEQVKSAVGNTGEFSRTNPDLRYADQNRPANLGERRATNLKKWFGDSVVKDENGNPATMYHGTPVWERDGRALGDIEQFDRNAARKAFPSRKPLMDQIGSWFSDRPDDQGAGMYGGGEGGAIYPVHLKIENPWRPKSFDEFLDRMRAAAGAEPMEKGEGGKGIVDPEPLRNELIKRGYDGIIFPKGAKIDGGEQQVHVTFHPEQVKSAVGNVGDFSPTHPDIRFRDQGALAARRAQARDTAPGERNGPRVTKEQATQRLQPIIDRVGADNLHVHDSLDDPAFPQHLRDDAAAHGHTDPRGVFDPTTGELHVFAGAGGHPDVESLHNTVVHELAHKGVRSFLGDDYAKTMGDIFNNIHSRESALASPIDGLNKTTARGWMRDYADQHNLDLRNPRHQALVADEYAAHLAELDASDPNHENPGVIQRVYDAVRAGLRKLGIVHEWTDDDVRRLLRQSNNDYGLESDHARAAREYQGDGARWADSDDRSSEKYPANSPPAIAHKYALNADQSANHGRGYVASRRSALDSFKRNAEGAWDNAKDKGRGAYLAFIPFRNLPDHVNPALLPAARELDALRRQMVGREGQFHIRDDGLRADWNRWAQENPHHAATLDNVIHLATLAQTDPSKPFENRFDDATHEKSPTKARLDSDRRAFYNNELRPMYDSLDDQGRQLYRDVRDTYVRKRALEDQAIEQRAADMGLDETSRKQLMRLLRKKFETGRITPYAPLMRFGDHWVRATDADGNIVSFSKHDTKRERQEEAARLQKLGYGVQSGRDLKEGSEGLKHVDPKFLTDIVKIVGDAENARALTEAIYQRYMESLPDQSFRKQRMPRSGVAGYSNNARRAFASYNQKAAATISRLEYEHLLDAKHEELRRQTEELEQRANDDPSLRRESDWASSVYKEFGRHLRDLRSPQNSRLADILTNFGYRWFLGWNAATASRIGMQQIDTAFPWLRSHHGTIGAGRELGRAMGQFAKAKGNFGDLLRGDERRAFDDMRAMGVFQNLSSHSLTAAAKGDPMLVSDDPGGVRKAAALADRTGQFLFNGIENFNRQSTALAAFRLAQKKGWSYEASVKHAIDASQSTHFEYGPTNRPSILKGPIGKVVGLFAQYRINQAYQIGRSFRDGFLPNEARTPAERRAARKYFNGMMLMGATVFGAGNLASPAFWAYNAIMGSNDNPVDSKAAMHEYLAEHLGSKFAADAIMHGAVSAVTRASMSSINYWDLAYRPPGRTESARAQMQEYLSRMGGALISIPMDVMQGATELAHGEGLRALEHFLPMGLRGIPKAIRYAREGVRGENALPGQEIVKPGELNPYELALQAANLSPEKVASAYDKSNAIANAKSALYKRADDILNHVALAYAHNDDKEIELANKEREDFLALHPGLAPILNNIAVRRKLAGASRAEDGIVIPKGLLDDPTMQGLGVEMPQPSGEPQ